MFQSIHLHWNFKKSKGNEKYSDLICFAHFILSELFISFFFCLRKKIWQSLALVAMEKPESFFQMIYTLPNLFKLISFFIFLKFI